MKVIFNRLVYCLVLIFSAWSLVAQQSLDLNNISSIDVDQLSDAQIQSFVSKVESSGYTETQLLFMAKSRGMTETQIQKLRNRIYSLSGTSSDSTNSYKKSTNENNIQLSVVDSLQMTTDDSLNVYQIDGLPIFGSEFFNNSVLRFKSSQSLPTPSNYVVGAGDEIIIDIWGLSEHSYTLIIDSEGRIKIPNVGPIRIGGLSIKLLESKVKSRLKKIYSTIGSGTHVDLSLGRTRSIGVHVIGLVNQPGTYMLSSLTSVFNALYKAGGPSMEGSMRKIDVFRDNKLISTFDAYQFLVLGTGENITLQDQDVVIVRPYQNRIKFKGDIKYAAIYELVEDETFNDLLYYSGGFTSTSYKGTVNIDRVTNNYKTILSINEDDYSTCIMLDGDVIDIGSISGEYTKRVTIEGAVINPSNYELKDRMDLKSLILQSGGLRGDAFMDRGIVIREKDNYSLSSQNFDLNKVMSDEDTVFLKNNDLVKIQSIYDLRDELTLEIKGEVRNPGSFVFIEGMTVKDLIYLAGGFNESAAKSFAEIARRKVSKPALGSNSITEILNINLREDLTLTDNDASLKLQPYDLVVVRRNPFFNEQKYVEIEGEVVYPGAYALEEKEERISSVLQRAFGVTEYAFVEGATLIRKSEYYLDASVSKLELTDDAVRIKKERLTEIFKEDTLFSNEGDIFRQEEIIGISLDKIIKEPRGKHDLVLKKGDIISVPKRLETVRIRGKVLYPTNVTYKDNFSLKNYVASAGGFSARAKRSKSYVIYANGSVSRTKSFFWIHDFPKIRPGTEIVIPSKPEKQPMTAQAWVSLSTGIATLALVINQIVTP